MKVLIYGNVFGQPKFRLRCFQCGALLEYGASDAWCCRDGAYVTCACCMAGNHIDRGERVVETDERKDGVTAEDSDA